jgi:hypothetical protein
MSESKQRLIELLDKLPPERVIELIEFAEFLQSKERRSIPLRETIMQIEGKYRDILPSTDEVAAQKQNEIDFEDGRL